MSVALRAPLVAVFFVLLLDVCSRPVAAQQFACWPIVHGDTAFSLALRLTGTSTSLYSDRFQIRDPARRRFVPKSQYQRLSPHWQACVAREIRAARAPLPPPRPPAEQRLVAYDLTPIPQPPPAAPLDLTLMWQVGATVSLVLFACAMIVKFVPDRAIPPDLQHAGEQFLAAFARPLIDPASATPPIRARLRFVRRAQQLEICIAPNVGRRYPNLSDHKTNVEYDVNRIAQLMRTHVVVREGLRAEGQWVVVPIRRADVNQAGAK
jgi:hypothetical protein